MDQLPQDGIALALLVFVLGIKHGLDADHLATIDGLTRYNALLNPGLARYCGTLFSLGHGGVVVVVASTASWAANAWTAPGWMESLGVFTSVFFLTLLGCANLLAIFQTPANQVVKPVGVKGRLLGNLQRAKRPSLIALVGALFALSFDTMSQAALFALSAQHEGEFWRAPVLGGVFMLGMMLTDGLNGLWISRILSRADRMAAIASRIMGLTVACLSLAVAALGAAKYFSPKIGGWMEGLELQTSLAVLATVCIAIAAGLLLSHWRLRHLQLALMLLWLMAAVSCNPKPSPANKAQANANSTASRAGGCAEGIPCTSKSSNKPNKDHDQYIALPPRLPFDQSIALGQKLLSEGKTTHAIDNFKQALWAAGSDEVKQQEAYGNIGLAYVAISDKPKAQAYLEKAGAKGEGAPAWIKDTYKHLLHSQMFMTANYLENKLMAENEVEKESAELLESDTNTRSLSGKPHTTVFSLDIRINFAFGSAKLTVEGEKQADELGKLLQQELQDSKQIAVLVGHTDVFGSQRYNDHLSEKRAAVVKHYLESKFPDLKGKLSEHGMGKRQPLYKETDEASRSLNQRIEVKLSRTAE